MPELNAPAGCSIVDSLRLGDRLADITAVPLCIQDIPQSRNAEIHVFTITGVTHQTDPPNFPGQSTEARTDFQSVLSQQRAPDCGVVNLLRK